MMRKHLILIVVFILIVTGVGGVYYTKNKRNTSLTESSSITTTIDVEGKKVKVTIVKPDDNDSNIVPKRGEIKNKEDFIIEQKDLETLKNNAIAEQNAIAN